MRNVTEKYLDSLAAEPKTWSEVIAPYVGFFQNHWLLLMMGIGSIALYFGLYLFNSDLIALAKQTYAGQKTLFFVPILLAFLFSFVHGAFTAKFWDSLGIAAKK